MYEFVFIKEIYSKMLKANVNFLEFDLTAYDRLAWAGYLLPKITDYNTNEDYYIRRINLPTINTDVDKVSSVEIELYDDDFEVYFVTLTENDLDNQTWGNLVAIVNYETKEL